MSWEIVLGLEVHCELATKSKIFCGCPTQFGNDPNTNVCPGCLALPGTLPLFNARVLEYAVKAGLALNCDINRENSFDRKHYFYPDLPSSFQTTQFYAPFATDGKVEFTTRGGKQTTVRISQIHMEEDAGKLVHSPFGDATWPDSNRGSVPLIEIVSAPDMRSAEEAVAYLEHLKSVLEYLEVSDCKMQEGSLRADINVSVRPMGSDKLGVRTEMKNLNSFKAIERAIAFESKRHIEVIESGGTLVQETRRWDDNRGKSFAMRGKENANDYRYMPAPDIPPICIEEDLIARLKAEQPEFAAQKAERYVAEFALKPKDAATLAASKHLARLFEQTLVLCSNAREVAGWMLGNMMYLMDDRGLQPEDLTLAPEQFAKFVKLIEAGTINRGVGKQVFEALFDHGTDPEQYVKDNDLAQVNDESLIVSTVQAVLDANPATVEQYKAGEVKVFGFLVGQCMKQLKGKASPEMINKVLKDALE